MLKEILKRKDIQIDIKDENVSLFIQSNEHLD